MALVRFMACTRGGPEPTIHLRPGGTVCAHEGNTVSLSNVKPSSLKGRKVYERPGRHPFFSPWSLRPAGQARGPGLFAIHRAVTSGADPDRDRVSGTETVFKNREELRAVTGAPAIPPDSPFYRRHGAHALPNPAGWPGASARLTPLDLPTAWSALYPTRRVGLEQALG